MCYADVYTTYLMYPTGMFFTAVMTTIKFLLLKYPFRASTWTKKKGHQVCGIIWISCTVAFPITFVVLRKDDAMFDLRVYDCNYGFTAPAWEILMPIYAIIFAFLPSIIIIGTTIPTLKYLVDASKSARRVKGSIPWQGAMTVALTAICFCILNLPVFVYFTGKTFVDESSTSNFHTQYFRLVTFLMKLNIMANFYIYALTIKRFKRFLYSLTMTVVPTSLLDSWNRSAGKNISSRVVI